MGQQHAPVATDEPPVHDVSPQISEIHLDIDEPGILRHDSEFSVGTEYDDGSPNNLSMWQGAALLTADCMGTGILALPADIKVLGWGLGLGFLIANLPINLYAGTILSNTATSVEVRQRIMNSLYRRVIGHEDDAEHVDYQAINADTLNSIQTSVTIDTQGTAHTQLHHDTATFDFIGLCQTLFKNRTGTRWVMTVYYVNLFLVLGNYILVMSHAVSAIAGEENLCIPTAGLIASSGMFIVSQRRTMAGLGRSASVLSLAALLIVVIQCLYAAQFSDLDLAMSDAEPTFLRKLSAFGSIGFAVGSQKLLLNIRHELSDRQQAPRSLAWSLSAFGTFYVVVILAAGSNPPGLLFDAIPPGLNRRIAGFLLWIHVIVSYAINSQAICSSLDRLVLGRMGIPRPEDPAKRWMFLTAVMAISAYTVANAVPFFKDLVALIGSLTSVPLTLLLPALFWRKNIGATIVWPSCESFPSYALVLYAGVFMVGATMGSLYSIDQDWSTHGPPFSCH